MIISILPPGAYCTPILAVHTLLKQHSGLYTPFFILVLFGPYFELFTLELANLFPGLVVGGH